MYLLYARVSFNNRQQRDRGATRAGTEASSRGLAAASFVWDDGFTSDGATAEGNTALRLSYAGPLEAVAEAHQALNVYLDANGRVDGVEGLKWESDA